MPGLSGVKCKSDGRPAEGSSTAVLEEMEFTRAFQDSFVLRYLRMEKITEVSLLPSEKAPLKGGCVLGGEPGCNLGLLLISLS